MSCQFTTYCFSIHPPKQGSIMMVDGENIQFLYVYVIKTATTLLLYEYGVHTIAQSPFPSFAGMLPCPSL